MVKNKWYLVSRKGKNFENFFISFLASSVAPKNSVKKRPLQLISGGWLQIAGNRYFLKQDLDKHIKKLHNSLQKNIPQLINDYEFQLNYLAKMEQSAETIPLSGFKKLDLINYLNKWSKLMAEALLYGYNYYFLNQEVSEIILKVLKRGKSQDIFKDFEIISQAQELSVIQKEKTDLLKIVKLIKEKKLKLNSQKVQQLINDHLEKYQFMGMFYFRGKPWIQKDIIKRLNGWLIDSNWLEDLKKLKYCVKADITTHNFFQKYKFNSYEKKVVELMKKMAQATNRYDEVNNYLIFKSQPFLKYLAKKIGVSYKQLIELNFSEVIELLQSNKKANSSLIKEAVKREQKSALICYKGIVNIYTGKKVDEIYKNEIGKDKLTKQPLLTGQCASQGLAKGKVVIFRSVTDMPKVKKGNVMVVSSTVPSFVPAMEKASAIVTEMGGLLSHAAIVSRELNVPCIIGVNNSTKILKDGDQVLVDANKGTIKKLK